MVKNKAFLFFLLSIMGISCIAQAAAYERLEPRTTGAKIVYMDLPFELLGRAPTAFERKEAVRNFSEGIKYKDGNYPEVGDKADVERGICLLHIAALYGEPTACAFMGRYYEEGLWGIIRNPERADLCRKNVGWWDKVSPKDAKAPEGRAPAARRLAAPAPGVAAASASTGEILGLRHRVIPAK